MLSITAVYFVDDAGAFMHRQSCEIRLCNTKGSCSTAVDVQLSIRLDHGQEVRL